MQWEDGGLRRVPRMPHWEQENIETRDSEGHKPKGHGEERDSGRQRRMEGKGGETQ